jgi:hypothetical protein
MEKLIKIGAKVGGPWNGKIAEIICVCLAEGALWTRRALLRQQRQHRLRS